VTRVCVIGLDCLTPQLVFSRWRNELPCLSHLASSALAGPIESTVPAISIPAWTSLVTGVDPGTLGTYGFHDRADYGYLHMKLNSSQDYEVPTLWTVLSRAGLGSRVAFVPQTFPPKPFAGFLIAGIPAPAALLPHTHPPELASELAHRWGELGLDVKDFRQQDRMHLWRQVTALTERNFALARAWLAESDWRFFMMVEIGADRIQHGYWQYLDQQHPRYSADAQQGRVVCDYYCLLDREVGRLLEVLREDDIVIIVSDHGAQSCRGGLALNDVLVELGYLRLRGAPREITALRTEDVDWRRSRAWASGGHVGRIYVNVHGREPEGIVTEKDVPALLDELGAALIKTRGPRGELLATTVYRPSRIYRNVRGIAPDLLVYLDDLAWRAIGSVGHSSIYEDGSTVGLDGASHSRLGTLILRDGRGARAAPAGLSLYDIAPTVLDRLNVPIPPYMIGRVLY